MPRAIAISVIMPKDAYLATLPASDMQASMGYTPKAVIDYVIVGKAKKMLLATGLTVQEIAGRLCFPDQATFGQYFKRNIGMISTEFRRRYR